MSKKNSTTEYISDTQEQNNATSIKLLEQGLEYMKTALDDIKSSITALSNKLENGFVTKEEFKSVKEDVRELQELKGWALRIILGSVIMALLALLWSQQ